MFRMDVSHLQRSECILKLPRATPGAIQVAGLSGRRKMCKLMWANGHFVTTTNFFTLSKELSLLFSLCVLLLIIEDVYRGTRTQYSA